MKILSKMRNGFLKFFGDIKVFKFPFFFLYDPGSYKVKGDEIRTVIETIQEGDILLRGYSNYLDGYFIPGFFSHTGQYLGKTQKSDLGDSDNDDFYEGDQVVIHSMAEGVFMEDVINFCKCDYLAILRRTAKIEPDLNMKESFKSVLKKALQHLGKDYDFKFDFSESGNLSCTELVFVCNEEIMPQYQVKIKERKVLFKNRQTLIPDDFLTNKFEIAFTSRSIKSEVIDKIRESNTP